MFSSGAFKCIALTALLAGHSSAFVPVTNGPTLDAKQGKIAGIGGIDGPKPVTSGGIGSFKVGSNSKTEPKKKESTAKVTKANNKKAAPEAKKKVDFWIKTPWSK